MVNIRKPDGLSVERSGEVIKWMGRYTNGMIFIDDEHDLQDRVFMWINPPYGGMLKCINGTWTPQPAMNFISFIGIDRELIYWAVDAVSPVKLIQCLPTAQNDQRRTLERGARSLVISSDFWVRMIDEHTYLLLMAGISQELIEELVYMHAYGKANGVVYNDSEDWM